MRDLTKAELEEYFRHAESDLKADNFTMDQATLIGEAFRDHKTLDAWAAKFVPMILTDRSPANIERLMVSLAVASFQMGRECESRLLTLALKGTPR